MGSNIHVTLIRTVTLTLTLTHPLPLTLLLLLTLTLTKSSTPVLTLFCMVNKSFIRLCYNLELVNRV